MFIMQIIISVRQKLNLSIIIIPAMNDIFPPDNYIRTESAVPGIEVYKPAPVDEAHREVVDFRCPRCDGVIAYSAADGGLTCAYCGYYEPPPQTVVGKGPEAFEFTVETMQRAAHGWGEARKEMVCNSCGAHTTLSLDMLTHTCPFCGSHQVVQLKAPQDVLRPRFLIPFTVDADACRRQTAEWLDSSWMTPADLQRLARTVDFTPIYIPVWTFDAQTSAEWRAEVGHTRTKAVTVNGKQQTRTYTEWRWESGHVEHFIDDLLVNGTTKISQVLLDRLSKYDLRQLVVYQPEFLAGTQAQAYDVTLDEAWASGRRRIREQIKQACQNQASTSKIRNFSMSLDFSQESWRYILLPVYLAAYRYLNQSYQVMVNGQTGAVAGQRPVAWRKVWLALAAMVAPGIMLGILALILIISATGEGTGAFVGVAAAIALALGLAFAVRTFQTARSLDDL